MNAQDVEQLLQRLQQEGFGVQQPSVEGEDEARPYKKRYQQAAFLEVQIKQWEEAHPGVKADDDTHLASLHVQRGVVLLDTDLLPEAEASVSAGLSRLERAVELLRNAQPEPSGVSSQACMAQPCLVVVLQSAYNGLGALWSRRGDLAAALSWLHRAEALMPWISDRATQLAAHNSTQQPGADALEDFWPARDEIHTATAPEGSTSIYSPPAVAQSWAAAAMQLEAGFTTTLFFLAQVHGHAGNKQCSAQYCGATLQRQLLAPAGLDRSEWVQNCLQLASFYLSERAFGIAQYCVTAARLVAAGAPDQDKARLDESGSADAEGGPREQAAMPVGASSHHMLVDADVVANLHLAGAKLCRERLSCSHTRHVLRSALPPKVPTQAPQFHSLAGQLEMPPHGEDDEALLATTFESARDLFNAGMTQYNAALGYYQLDGWVTEHVNILLEVSSIYRLLADFEPDAQRRAAMHKQRATRLEAVCALSLNPDHYLHLVRALELEAANSWRDCLAARSGMAQHSDDTCSIKSNTAHVKAMVTAAQSSVKHYRAALSTWQPPASQGYPARITPEEEEQQFLTTCFSLGRVLHRCCSDSADASGSTSRVAQLAQARDHIEWTCTYVKRNKVAAFQEEAALAASLAQLIMEKINLTRRLADV